RWSFGRNSPISFSKAAALSPGDRIASITFASSGEVSITADDLRAPCLRLFVAALGNVSSELLDGRQVSQFERSVVGLRHEMSKGAVVELDHHVSEVLGRLGLQRLEHSLDQAAILRHSIGLHLVAHQLVFHRASSVIGASATGWVA